MMSVTAADLYDKYVGQTEKAIKALFSLGRKLHPCIIFIDEAETLLQSRKDSERGWQRSCTNQFLTEMDGLVKSACSPTVILATNFPHMLDFAVLRRVPCRLFIGLPLRAARRQIIAICLRDDLVSDEVDLDDLARETRGFSGSDIQTLCYMAALCCKAADAEGHSGDGRALRRADFDKALQRTSPTVTNTALSQIRAFARENDPSAISRIDAADDGAPQHAPTPPLPAAAAGALAPDTLAPSAPSSAPIPEIQGEAVVEAPVPSTVVEPDTARAGAEDTSTLLPLPNAKPESSIVEKSVTGSGLTPLYTPLKHGGKQIRVLSFEGELPDESVSNRRLLNCKLETVDLDEQELWYLEVSPAIDQALGNDPPNRIPAWHYSELLPLSRLDPNARFDVLLEEVEGLRPRFLWGDYIAMSYTWVGPIDAPGITYLPT